MKTVYVTLELKTDSDASIEEIINDIAVDLYGKIEQVVSIQGEEVNEQEDV